MIARLIIAVIVLLVAAAHLQAQGLPPSAILEQVGIDQRLQADVPLELKFRDETGREVQLSDYFDGRPVILVLAYYRCPMLCTQVLNGLVDCLRALPLEMNREYRVLTVSIDPRETAELAAEKKTSYLHHFDRAGAEAGWHFLVGDDASIRRLSESVGYRFAYDSTKDQFAHGSGIMVLTPQGKVSRYFLGITYPANDVKLALVEAANGKVGSLADQLLLLCFHYDESTGRYTLAVLTLVRITGAIAVLVIVSFISRWLWRERRAKAACIPLTSNRC